MRRKITEQPMSDRVAEPHRDLRGTSRQDSGPARRDAPTVVRAAARGLAAAMAMTGFRTLAGNVGLMETAPPEALVKRYAPRGLRQPGNRRAAATELVHWTYGTGCGVLFGLLPRRVRARGWTGPCYGLAIWLIFELAVAPALRLRHNTQRRVLGRVMLALDHVLYGVIVAGQLAPEPELTTEKETRPTTRSEAR